MDANTLTQATWGAAFLVLIIVVALSRRARRHGGSFRAGVAGAMYEWQNQDKQRALDVIVEERAAERRPESPDGNLPDLASPGGRRHESRRGGATREGVSRPLAP